MPLVDWILNEIILSVMQCQATNECFEQSALVKNNGETSEVTTNGALKSANGNDEVPSKATGEHAFAPTISCA